MIGVITTRHIARYCVLIIQCYGLRTLMLCVIAVVTHKRTTFLQVAYAATR